MNEFTRERAEKIVRDGLPDLVGQGYAAEMEIVADLIEAAWREMNDVGINACNEEQEFQRCTYNHETRRNAMCAVERVKDIIRAMMPQDRLPKTEQKG